MSGSSSTGPPSGGAGSRPSVDSGWNRSRAPLPASLPSRPPVVVGGSASSERYGSGGSRGGSSWRDTKERAREPERDRERDYHVRDREYDTYQPDREYRDRRREADYEWSRSRDSRPPKERYPSHRDRSSSPRGSHWTPRTRDRSPSSRNRVPESSYRLSPRDTSPHRSFARQSPPLPGPSSYRPNRDREQSSYFPAVDRNRERDHDRSREKDFHRDDGTDRSFSPNHSSSERAPLRRGGLSSWGDASSEYRRGRSPADREDHSPPPPASMYPRESYDAGVSTSRRPSGEGDYTQGGPSAPVQAPTGPASGIPTGPRGSNFFGRGGPPRGRGAMRGGGVIPRGPSYPRGVGLPGGPSGWSGRGRGGAMIRGRGRGGMMGGVGSKFDDPPARSLARKVDAGGNAMAPDLLPVSSAHEELVSEGDLEEGEREEGEMETVEGVSSYANLQSQEAESVGRDQDTHDEQVAAHSGSHQHYSQASHRSDDLHLGSLPNRQSFSQLAHTEARSASGSNTPQTPTVAPTASIQNPYSSAPRTARASIAATSALGQAMKASQPAMPVRAAIPTYSANDFPRSVQPEWDAEMWTMSAHRLAGVAQLPLSSNYNVPISAASAPPATASTPSVTTPGALGPAASVSATTAAANLRRALLDLKEATMEMEMSGFRRDECERSRAELM